jgi:solute carrier family 25 (mitochondrial carnitine/acylcarnitine transporter), member 20/29
MQAHDIVPTPTAIPAATGSGANPAALRNGPLTGTWRTALTMYAESGGRIFLRGLMPTMMRAVPVNMAVFGTFEAVVWAFS